MNKNKQKDRSGGSGQRYIRLLMVIVMIVLLAVLTVIIWDRAELAKEELSVKTEDTPQTGRSR